MRATTIALTILGFLSTGLPAPLRAQPPTGGPCAQITAECKQAGFEANGDKMGIGLPSIASVQSSQARSNGSRPPSLCRKSIPESWRRARRSVQTLDAAAERNRNLASGRNRAGS
jgi:hypothetical protein